jgi:16S rRNA (guanine966-N2)-methyltransferase
MKFKAPNNIRPTTSRVREAIFNILRSELGSFEGLNILDLFAGSGALGLTALQNGATKLTAVDSSLASCEAIKENANKLQLAELVNLQKLDCKRINFEPKSFDLIFADPPYDINLQDLSSLLNKIPNYLTTNGIFVLELRANTVFNEELQSLTLLSKRIYGDTGLWFWQQK